MTFPAVSRVPARSRIPEARCDTGSRRVIPHDATVRRVNRRIPNLFTAAKFAKSSHSAKFEPAGNGDPAGRLLPQLQEHIVHQEPVPPEQIGKGAIREPCIILVRCQSEMSEFAVW